MWVGLPADRDCQPALRTQQLQGSKGWGQGRHQEWTGAERHSPKLGACIPVLWPSLIRGTWVSGL